MIDRFWFRSIYFREPSGVLFEIATLGPGFATDEDPAHLGETLILPPAFEHLRAQVEPILTPLPNPRESWTRTVTLRALERPAAGEPEGALVLLHGRGADEHDLFPLLDALDPERRLQGYTPRAPLALPPGGAHWYVVPRVGYPDPATFAEGYAALTGWFDALPFPADRDRARRLLAGRGHELRARPRAGAAAHARADRAQRLHPDRRRAGSPTSRRRSRRSRSRTARTTP